MPRLVPLTSRRCGRWRTYRRGFPQRVLGGLCARVDAVILQASDLPMSARLWFAMSPWSSHKEALMKCPLFTSDCSIVAETLFVDFDLCQ